VVNLKLSTWRWLPLALLPLTTAASPSGPTVPNAKDMGDILLQADGPNLYVIALFFLLFLQFIERLWASAAAARAATRAAETNGAALDRATDAVEGLERQLAAELHMVRSELVVIKDRQDRSR